jgi:hypothetical protein
VERLRRKGSRKKLIAYFPGAEDFWIVVQQGKCKEEERDGQIIGNRKGNKAVKRIKTNIRMEREKSVLEEVQRK